MKAWGQAWSMKAWTTKAWTTKAWEHGGTDGEGGGARLRWKQTAPQLEPSLTTKVGQPMDLQVKVTLARHHPLIPHHGKYIQRPTRDPLLLAHPA